MCCLAGLTCTRSVPPWTDMAHARCTAMLSPMSRNVATWFGGLGRGLLGRRGAQESAHEVGGEEARGGSMPWALITLKQHILGVQYGEPIFVMTRGGAQHLSQPRPFIISIGPRGGCCWGSYTTRPLCQRNPPARVQKEASGIETWRVPLEPFQGPE